MAIVHHLKPKGFYRTTQWVTPHLKWSKITRGCLSIIQLLAVWWKVSLWCIRSRCLAWNVSSLQQSVKTQNPPPLICDSWVGMITVFGFWRSVYSITVRNFLPSLKNEELMSTSPLCSLPDSLSVFLSVSVVSGLISDCWKLFLRLIKSSPGYFTSESMSHSSESALLFMIWGFEGMFWV